MIRGSIFWLTITASLLSACGRENTFVVSKSFDLCVASRSDGSVSIEVPVDVEFVKLHTRSYDADLIVDKYPRVELDERAEANAPVLNEDIGLRLLSQSNQNGLQYAYVRFDSLAGDTYPHGYSQILFKPNANATPKEDVTFFLKSLQRCGK